jgi:hypothetical protein
MQKIEGLNTSKVLVFVSRIPFVDNTISTGRIVVKFAPMKYERATLMRGRMRNLTKTMLLAAISESATRIETLRENATTPFPREVRHRMTMQRLAALELCRRPTADAMDLKPSRGSHH